MVKKISPLLRKSEGITKEDFMAMVLAYLQKNKTYIQVVPDCIGGYATKEAEADHARMSVDGKKIVIPADVVVGYKQEHPHISLQKLNVGDEKCFLATVYFGQQGCWPCGVWEETNKELYDNFDKFYSEFVSHKKSSVLAFVLTTKLVPHRSGM